MLIHACRYHYSSNNRTRGVPVVEEQCSLEGVVRLAESSQVFLCNVQCVVSKMSPDTLARTLQVAAPRSIYLFHILH